MRTLPEARDKLVQVEQEIAVLEALETYKTLLVDEGLDETRVKEAYDNTIKWLERYEERRF